MTRRPLPSDPLLLLRESAEAAPPDGARARVASRLAGLALAGPHAGSGHSGGALGSTGRPSWGVLGRRFLRWSVAPLGVGIAIGAGGQALVTAAQQGHEGTIPVSLARPSASAAPVVMAPPPAEPASVPTTSSQPSVQPPRSTLVDERVLLDRARRQLASDEPARALVFLEQHAQRFARGELSEEREAMRINVLVQLGRKDEAKASGDAFAVRFPNSIMGASVRAALKAAEVTN